MFARNPEAVSHSFVRQVTRPAQIEDIEGRDTELPRELIAREAAGNSAGALLGAAAAFATHAAAGPGVPASEMLAVHDHRSAAVAHASPADETVGSQLVGTRDYPEPAEAPAGEINEPHEGKCRCRISGCPIQRDGFQCLRLGESLKRANRARRISPEDGSPCEMSIAIA